MSLRGFFIWFWSIVAGSGVAGGATLAMLKAPEKPPAAPPGEPLAITEPLPLPPLGAIAEPPPAGPEPLPLASRPALRMRETRPAPQSAERITVVPPIPPEPVALRARPERRAHAVHLAIAHRHTPPETRSRTVPEEEAPPPARRFYTYAPGYRRYSYDTYTYTYPQPYFPYRFSFSYRY